MLTVLVSYNQGITTFLFFIFYLKLRIKNFQDETQEEAFLILSRIGNKRSWNCEG